MTKRLFVTGTGTDVGKTFVTALIIKKLRERGNDCAYYKAAMSGNARDEITGKLIPGDAVQVKRVSGINQPLDEMCPYVYERAVSPHLAARLEGVPVEMQKVCDGFTDVCRKYDYVTMEGSGGIICPIRRDEMMTIGLDDIVKSLELSCLIVADAGLGAINSVVLTVEYMRQKQIPAKGIVFNRFHRGNVMEEDNLLQCEAMTGVKVVACIEENASDFPLDGSALEALYE